MEETTGFMDKLAGDVAAFEVESSLPQLDNVIGLIELVAKVAVVIGPILLLVLGLIYWFSPPAEANHKFGYRFYWGMGSVEAWRFTQRIAGTVWSALGLVLTVIMVPISLGFRAEKGLDMAKAAFTCLIIELVLIGLACIAIDVVVAMRYDRKGQVRPDTRIPENFLELPKKK